MTWLINQIHDHNYIHYQALLKFKITLTLLTMGGGQNNPLPVFPLQLARA